MIESDSRINSYELKPEPIKESMRPIKISLQEALQLGCPIFDVRSPSEYKQGHIPSAVNIPILSDEGRALVGTIYKKQGSSKAYLKGLELAGPEIGRLVALAQSSSKGQACIYCWRGGLRSNIFATLLAWSGVQVFLLDGGYKTFRNWVLEKFNVTFNLQVLGGMTGTGKTALLQTFLEKGDQVIDLEKLARHRGSAFGAYEGEGQPSCEHFENTLALNLHQLDPSKPIWVEDESRMIGRCKIPDALYAQMQTAPFIELKKSIEERLARLVEEYSACSTNDLISATQKLQKKLGGVRTKLVIENIQKGDLHLAASLLMEYYDAQYIQSLQKKSQFTV